MSVVDRNFLTDGTGRAIAEALGEVATAIENGGGGGGTTVTPNPQGEPTDDLETIQIGNTIYDIPGSGTPVTPNPQGEPTANLETIQIGNTIYDIPGDENPNFIINVTKGEEWDPGYEWEGSMDKTYAEIEAAFNAGKNLYVDLADDATGNSGIIIPFIGLGHVTGFPNEYTFTYVSASTADHTINITSVIISNDNFVIIRSDNVPA